MDEARRRAMRRALNMLSYRSRSRHEIFSDLRGRGFSEEIAGGIVSELESKGLVCDVLLARDIISGGQRSGRSRARIYAELRRRGIDRQTIDESLHSCFDQEVECEAAARLLSGMIAEGQTSRADFDLERAARRLSGRGFSPAAITYALGHVPFSPKKPG